MLTIATEYCERAFSTMRRVKSRLRSQMNNSTLNNCIRISMEGPPLETFNFDKAPDSWSKPRNRSTKVQTLGANIWPGVDSLKSCCTCMREALNEQYTEDYKSKSL